MIDVLDEIYYAIQYVISDQMAEYDLSGFFSDILYSFTEFVYLAFPLIIIFAALLAVSNIVFMIRAGKSLANVLGLSLSVGLIAGTAVLYFLYFMLEQIMDVHSYVGCHFEIAIDNIVSVSLTYLECMLAATIIVTIKVVHYEPAFDKNYLIVLGCYVMPDGSPSKILRKRIDAAYEFAMTQKRITGKEPIIIASGGKGDDETISEAKCMQNYLRKTKKYPGKIILEDKSTTTRENFSYSKKLLEKYDQIAFATTDYHVFRSGMIAENTGLKTIVGVGAKSPWYYYNNAIVREFVANMYSERKLHIGILSFLIITMCILLIVSFMFGIM